jgi:hypothetical protein
LSDAQLNPTGFFLDKNHGNLIRDLMRRVRLQVFTHREFGWPGDKPDVEIIAECAARNLIILSGDKSIERVPVERQAVINGRCKVFMFDDSHITLTEDWLASLLVGRHKILEIISHTSGPLFVTIKPCHRSGHIGTPRFVKKAGGGWLPKGKSAAVPVSRMSHAQGPQRPLHSQQILIPFPERPKQ